MSIQKYLYFLENLLQYQQKTPPAALTPCTPVSPIKHPDGIHSACKAKLHAYVNKYPISTFRKMM